MTYRQYLFDQSQKKKEDRKVLLNLLLTRPKNENCIINVIKYTSVHLM